MTPVFPFLNGPVSDLLSASPTYCLIFFSQITHGWLIVYKKKKKMIDK